MTEKRHRVAISPMRAAIARRMVQSKQQAPHFYVSTEVDMDTAVAATDRLNEGRAREERITLTAVLVKAVALTLADHPAFNATWNGDVLERVDSINVGVAIALDDGLIAPALLNCQDLDVEGISVALRDLVTRTRAGKLRAREINDATFTLSNLGMFDVSAFTAIITPPQVAILATAKTEARPVVREGEIVARQVMTATLSSDHRAVDGGAAARFLGELRSRLEAPDAWLTAHAASMG